MWYSRFDMSEHIPGQPSSGEPTEPQSSAALDAHLRGLDYQQLRQTYYRLREQFEQEGSRDVRPATALQLAEIAITYPGLHEMILAMSYNPVNDRFIDPRGMDFADGILAGAVTVLSMIKSTIEVQELNRSFDA